MASRTEITDEIESLALHCRPPLMSIEERSRWMQVWCEDLKEFDIEAIRHACKKWRMGEDGKFPTIGKLLPLVRSVSGSQSSGNDRYEEWRPLTDWEYDQLSLSEKIRHNLIVAAKLRQKAGPQCRGKIPVPPSEMPQEWHDLRAKANGFEAEAKRLRQYKTGMRDAALIQQERSQAAEMLSWARQFVGRRP